MPPMTICDYLFQRIANACPFIFFLYRFDSGDCLLFIGRIKSYRYSIPVLIPKILYSHFFLGKCHGGISMITGCRLGSHLGLVVVRQRISFLFHNLSSF